MSSSYMVPKVFLRDIMTDAQDSFCDASCICMFRVIDMLILVFLTSVLSLVVCFASGSRYEMQPAFEIDLNPANIPKLSYTVV